jgi:hypothetical protein
VRMPSRNRNEVNCIVCRRNKFTLLVVFKVDNKLFITSQASVRILCELNRNDAKMGINL